MVANLEGSTSWLWLAKHKVPAMKQGYRMTTMIYIYHGSKYIHGLNMGVKARAKIHISQPGIHLLLISVRNKLLHVEVSRINQIPTVKVITLFILYLAWRVQDLKYTCKEKINCTILAVIFWVWNSWLFYLTYICWFTKKKSSSCVYPNFAFFVFKM